jgi:crossover junction endodeoxyribonuclease RuvC
MIVVGIDPGIQGAAAAFCPKRGMIVDVIDLPTLMAGKRREINLTELFGWLRRQGTDKVILENVHSMPGDGHVGAFQFGMAFGMIRVICREAVGSALEMVEPQVWKAYFDLVGCDKEASRQLALQLFPMHAARLVRKQDHQRAEAMLIAKWGDRPIIGRNW